MTAALRTMACAGLLASAGAITACGAEPLDLGEGNEVPTATLRQALPLPTPTGACPKFVNGNMTFLGQRVRVWKGAAATGGSLVIYWHSTGAVGAEAVSALGQSAINEITANGGIVAAPETSIGSGNSSGLMIWHSDDFAMADEIVACASKKLHIDPTRVFTMGFSAGGLQATALGYARSDYIASVVAYSGGVPVLPAPPLQVAGETPSVMAVHGDPGEDVVAIDFADASRKWEVDIKSQGGLVVDCNHGGGHWIPSGIAPSSWRFLKNHPYNVSPEPWATGLPASFPSYCTVF